MTNERVVGPVYRLSSEDREASNIDKSERSLKAKFPEHKKLSSSTSKVRELIHVDHPEHPVDITNAKILEAES